MERSSSPALAHSVPSTLEKASYEDEYVQELHRCLEQLHLPPLIDRSAKVEPRQKKQKHNKRAEVTIAVLSRATDRLATLIEGGEQLRESVFLCVSHTWLERDGGTLLMHKGAWLDASTGQAYVDRYSPPRKVTYFANFFTTTATFGERTEGEPLEDGVDCPLSLSHHLEHFINDKLFQRCVLAHGNVAFPRTLAFSYDSERIYDAGGANAAQLKIVRLDKRDASVLGTLRKSVSLFAASLPAGTRLVVKRGGPTRVPKPSSSYHSTVDTAVDRIVKVLSSIPAGDSVFVEEFLPTMPSQRIVEQRNAALIGAGHASATVGSPVSILRLQERLAEQDSIATTVGAAAAASVASTKGAKNGDDDDNDDDDATDDKHLAAEAEARQAAAVQATSASQLSFVVRVLTVRSAAGAPVVASTVAFVTPAARPSNRATTLPYTVHQCLRQWGVSKDEDRQRMVGALEGEALRVHRMMITAETALAKEASLAKVIRVKDAGSDVISTDLVLSLRGSQLQPIVIRVHDHDSFKSHQQLEEITQRRGECVRPWIETMIARSQAYLMRGNLIILCGAGGYGHWRKFEMWNEMGIRVVIVDEKDNHPCIHLAHAFIHVPTLAQHADDEKNADLVIEALAKAGFTADNIDGVTTIYDPAVVLASWVARKLGKHGNAPHAHEIGKDKYATVQHLRKLERSADYLAAPKMFVATSIEVDSVGDVDKALVGASAPMRLPCVLKNTHGMCGIGVKLVRTVDEARREFTHMKSSLMSGIGSDGSGLSFGGKMFLMEYLDGSEHDVDIVMFNGELVAAMVTDNGPTRLPYFNESSAVMPSLLHNDEVASLVAGAHACCRGAELLNGVFNVEMKYTSQGPRLIEINARLGGFYLTDWALKVYNVHLLRCVAQIACGIRPVIREVMPAPRCHMAGLQLYPTQHGKVLRSLVPADERKLSVEERVRQNRFRTLEARGIVTWISMAAAVGSDDAEWEFAYGNVGCEGRSALEAATRLCTVVDCLQLDANAALPVSYFMTSLGALPPAGSVASVSTRTA